MAGNRRNFFRQMIGGVAAAAAVRTWPFRVYSFPSEVTYWWKPECIFPIQNPVVGQTVYTTAAGGNTYIKVGDIVGVQLEHFAHELPEFFRVTEVERGENTMTITNIPRTRWPR